ncbi:hypothetical protein [uncultured Dokdonia sp.]|uniref:hypothetical protein n=1 Tax=uncultured Dokdonia sp. TaxID=575653 RepID=UPI0026322A60|nr:hypothetical protein [uncultured Dokdonia sp.]
MEILKTLTTKTCFFKIQTSLKDQYIAQENGSGTSGHLWKRTLPNPSSFSDYSKFLLYPDPSSEGTYRIVVVGWPELEVILEHDRARIIHPQDSDLLRFNFQIAPRPASETDESQEWYYLNGIGVDLNFDFASHHYVFPSKNPYDLSKLKFVPVDIVQPKAENLQESIILTTSDLAPPQNYEEVATKEWGNKVISKQAIPAALITDTDYRTKSDQIKLSPYYYLQHEKLWSAEQLDIITLSKNQKTTIDTEYTSAFKSSDYKSVEKTVGHTFNTSIELYGKGSAEVGVSEGGETVKGRREVGATLKLAYQYQNQTKTINQSSNSEEKSIKERITQEYRQLKIDEDDIFLLHWLPIDRYTLFNSKGVIKGKWDYTSSSRPIPQEIKRTQKVKLS